MQFPGKEEDFPAVFKEVCTENDWDAMQGWDEPKFQKVINDDQGDFYCENEVLATILRDNIKELRGPDEDKETLPDRREYITELFKHLDFNHDKCLQEKEMTIFVKNHKNLPNDSISWAMTYTSV
jgi:hypothetical protein